MKRSKLVILMIAAIALVVLSVSLYEATPVSMSDILPDDHWTRAQLFLYRSNETQAMDIEGVGLEQLLAVLDAAVVNNGTKFTGMSPPYFHIHLAESDGPGTLIYVLENGRIAIAVDCDTENYKYYEGGAELYQAVLQLAAE